MAKRKGKKAGAEEKRTEAESFFGDRDKLNRQFIEKSQTRPLKPVKQVEKEEKESGLVPAPDIDFASPKTTAGGFRPSFAAQDLDMTEEGTLESSFGNLLSTMTNPKKIEHFTELDDREIIAISACEAANTTIRSPVLELYISKFKQHRVSKTRAGRIEIKDIATAMIQAAENSAKKALAAVREGLGGR